MQVQLLEHVILQSDKESEVDKQQRWHAPIRDIFIQETDTGEFIFWGKTKHSRWVEQLDVKWMNENKLDPGLREKFIHANKIGKLVTLPWDISSQTPRHQDGIQTAASLLRMLKTPVCCDLFVITTSTINSRAKTDFSLFINIHAKEKMFTSFLNQFPRLCTKKIKRQDKKTKSKWLTRPPIDRVFAKKLESGDSIQFTFWGRLQTDTRLADKLTTVWMDKNHMGIEFREKLKKRPRSLFELPVETKHLTVRFHSKCCHGFDDRFSPMSILAHSASRLSVKGIRLLDLSPFRQAPHQSMSNFYSLLNAVTAMGLPFHEKQLVEQFQHLHTVSLKECAHYFKTLGGFTHHNWRSDEYHPYYNNDRNKLALVRICRVRIDSANEFYNKNSQRDSHTIAIFNNFIYDSLMTQPIKLSIDNLHQCCLGGRDYIFHHSSESHVFTPKPDAL